MSEPRWNEVATLCRETIEQATAALVAGGGEAADERNRGRIATARAVLKLAEPPTFETTETMVQPADTLSGFGDGDGSF